MRGKKLNRISGLIDAIKSAWNNIWHGSESPFYYIAWLVIIIEIIWFIHNLITG